MDPDNQKLLINGKQPAQDENLTLKQVFYFFFNEISVTAGLYIKWPLGKKKIKIKNGVKEKGKKFKLHNFFLSYVKGF